MRSGHPGAVRCRRSAARSLRRPRAAAGWHPPDRGRMTVPLIAASNLVRSYASRKGLFGQMSAVRAVNGVSLALRPAETLGVVGESGSGKSTLGRLVLGIEAPDGGEVRFK